MRRILCSVCVLVLLCSSLQAVEVDLENAFAVGDWEVQNGRLVQTDINAGKAKFVIPLAQEGRVEYKFNVMYHRGVLDDGHGGFGIHVFADSVLDTEAWGAGQSWLLWFNYDPSASNVIPGLSAQVYQSLSHSRMNLIAEYDLNTFITDFAEAGITVVEALTNPVPVRITINGRTGDVRVYSPVDEEFFYAFQLPLREPLKGNYVALRTNGVSLSFAQ